MTFSSLMIIRVLLMSCYVVVSLVTWGLLRGEHHSWVFSPAAFLLSWSGLPAGILRSLSVTLPEEGFLSIFRLLLFLVIPAYFYLWLQLPVHWARKGRVFLFDRLVAFHFAGALIMLGFVGPMPAEGMSRSFLVSWIGHVGYAIPQLVYLVIFCLLDRSLCLSMQEFLAPGRNSPETRAPQSEETLPSETGREGDRQNAPAAPAGHDRAVSRLASLRAAAVIGYLVVSLWVLPLLVGSGGPASLTVVASWSFLPYGIRTALGTGAPATLPGFELGLFLVLIPLCYLYGWVRATHNLARSGRTRLYVRLIAFHFVGVLLALLVIDFPASTARHPGSWTGALPLILPQVVVTLLYLLLDRQLCLSLQSVFLRGRDVVEIPGATDEGPANDREGATSPEAGRPDVSDPNAGTHPG
ncbi:MAG: hypothetical protein KA419_09685 [Acidobacteria bacterium]|nr:hypothetical protein [Acidobacteriota bacterium]